MTDQSNANDVNLIDDYQAEALKTAIYPKHLGILYTISGELGEAGEKAAVLLSVLDRAQRDNPDFNSSDLLLLKAAISSAVTACSVVEILKKKARKGLLAIHPLPPLLPEEIERIKSEGGDGLWYQAGTAHEAGLSLSSVAQGNVVKLRERKSSGTIASKGESIEDRKANLKTV